MKKSTLNIIPALAPAIALYTDTYPDNCLTRSEMLNGIQDVWQTQYRCMTGLDLDGSLTEMVKGELGATKIIMNALFYIDIKLAVRTDNSRYVQAIDLAHQHSDKAIPRYMDARDLADAFTDLKFALAPWAAPNPARELVADYLADKEPLPASTDLYMACCVMANTLYDKLGVSVEDRDKIDKDIAAHYVYELNAYTNVNTPIA